MNGLLWPVSTDGKKIQIGCQCHTVKEWGGFTDEDITRMETRALEWWKQFKHTVLAMAEYRASQGE